MRTDGIHSSPVSLYASRPKPLSEPLSLEMRTGNRLQGKHFREHITIQPASPTPERAQRKETASSETVSCAVGENNLRSQVVYNQLSMTQEDEVGCKIGVKIDVIQRLWEDEF